MCLAQGHNTVTPERPECSRYSIAAHSSKIKMRGSREGWQRVLTPTLENWKPLGLFSNTGPDPLENQKLPSQHSILGNYRPASVLLLG